MTYTFTREELEQFKNNVVKCAGDFLVSIVKCREKFPIASDDFSNINDPVVIVQPKKYSELVKILEDNLTKAIKEL